jgi:hypothetical protein
VQRIEEPIFDRFDEAVPVIETSVFNCLLHRDPRVPERIT